MALKMHFWGVIFLNVNSECTSDISFAGDILLSLHTLSSKPPGSGLDEEQEQKHPIEYHNVRNRSTNPQSKSM